MTASIDLAKGTVQFRRRTEDGTEEVSVEDEFKRELSFYQQALAAASAFRDRVLDLGKAFSKPGEYFADMFKNVTHMRRITKRQEEQQESAKKSAAAKQQRLNRRFGKQIQVAKQQERAEQKRKSIQQIESFKRKRSNVSSLDDTEDGWNRKGKQRRNMDDDFDIEIDADEPTARSTPKRGFKSAGRGGFKSVGKRAARPTGKRSAKPARNRPGKSTRQQQHSQKLKSMLK